VKQLRSVDLKRLHRSWQRRTDQRVALLLDGVQDPFNIGGIIRTAAALRVERLYLCAHSTLPTHPKVGKTSRGTERYVEWSEYEHSIDGIAAARDDGLRVVALELTEDAAPVFEVDLADDVCLVVGNESNGASATVIAACDAVAYLPLLGRVGSLNVATATAIALYEARRQGWTRGAEWTDDA
jgi:tRNA (guanosine-2'-O-)-methyltransferase